MKKLLLLVALLIFGLPYGLRVNNRHAMRVFSEGEGHCTAYVSGQHEVITAAHCEEAGATTVWLNGSPYHILGTKHDGNDHVKITLSGKRLGWQILPLFKAVQSQAVYMYGNPGDFHNFYRQGYLMGQAHDAEGTNRYGESYPIPILDTYYMMAGPGDSGSIIFSYWGYPVGMVKNASGQLTGSVPFGTFK